MHLLTRTVLHRAVPAFAVLALVSGIPAQTSRNVELLGTLRPSDSGFNDIWGYVAPDGREYAILGGRQNTYVVDCTNPRQPVLRGTFPSNLSGWSSSTWRDIRTYRNYAYVVTEGGGGMQILDLSNPDQPTYVRTFTLTGWTNTHNIAIDTVNGRAYPCGASNVGTPVLDIATDPANPTRIAGYTAQYVHDLHIQNGFAFLAEINRSTFRIVDVANLPTITSVGSIAVSACHNAWATRDDRYAITTSETTNGNGYIRVFDIGNRASPQLISSYRTGATNTSVHNAYVRDRVIHAAYYSEGYRCVDLSDPMQPLELGYYDTHTSTSGYNGAWGCYAFQPSGTIYISDISNGLFVLKPKGAVGRYGTATAGTAGEPAIHGFGGAFQGNANFALELENAPANAAAVLVIGTARADLPILGIRLNVDVSLPHAILSATTDANGKLKVPLPVPASSGLSGDLVAQFVVQDASGPAGLTATRGLSFSVFAR